MAIDYGTIRPALATLIGTLAGINLANTVWEDQGQQWGKVQVRLKIASPVVIGTDRIRYNEPNASELEATVVGDRQVTLSVSVESISQEDDGFAAHYAELIRTRLRRTSSLESLKAAGLSISTVNQLIEVPMNDGDHHWSKFVLDIRFNTVANDSDTTWDTNCWIETVNVQGTLET